MPVERSLDPQHGFVRAVWTGVIRTRDLGDGIQRLFAEPSLAAVGRSLADMRLAQLEVGVADVTSTHLGIIAPTLANRQWRIAILVGSDLQYGICRQFTALTSSHIDGAVFMDEREAIEWLLRDR